MAAAFEFLSARILTTAAALAIGVAAAAGAQSASQASQQQQPSSTSTLGLPENPQLFGQAMPSVVKATAIVNGAVITQTDVDHNLAMMAMANGGKLPTDQIDQLRQQILRNLIDETLQIQAAKALEIEITERDIDRFVQRAAENMKTTPAQFAEMLKANGSSIQAFRRQVHSQVAWERLKKARIENSVSVGDEEVKAVLDRMNAAKGSTQYRVGEIFLVGTQATMPQTMAKANQILDQLRQGGSFVAYAKQYSEASTAAVGGDLGWVYPEQLPDQLARVVRAMSPGQISTPIPVQGGVSIIAVQDSRKILTADPRNAALSLKQVSISFPAGSTRQQVEARIAQFAQAAQNVGGCGGADRIANQFNGEMIERDQIRLRDLPPALQEIMLPLQVGQATRPFGSVEEGVRILVICGRDEVSAAPPSFDDVVNQMTEERMNLRARRYLRDLRRDAVIEFR